MLQKSGSDAGSDPSSITAPKNEAAVRQDTVRPRMNME